MFSGKQPPSEYLSWLKGTREAREGMSKEVEKLSDVVKGDHPDNQILIQQWAMHLREKAQKGDNLSININVEPKGPLKLAFQDTPSGQYIHQISISSSVSGDFTIIDARIVNQVLPVDNLKKLSLLEDCWIEHLHINLRGGLPSEVTLKNCHIAQLKLDPGSAKRLIVEGGSILDIDCPTPSQDNPFTGEVYIASDVFLPGEPNKYRLRDAQPYRNLRHHLSELKNTTMADKFHAMELSVERKQDPNWTSLLSWFYEMGSRYGASSGRPALWLFLFFVGSFFLVGFFDGALPAKDPHEYRGWEKSLLDKPDADCILQVQSDCISSSQSYRAFVMSGNAALPPLRLFRIGSLVVPRTGWVAAWIFFQTVASTILLALLFLAIRRRFKMQL